MPEVQIDALSQNTPFKRLQSLYFNFEINKFA